MSDKPAEQAYHARGAGRWVAIADGEGAEARPLFGDKPHQEFHDFMCVCGQPWKECTTDGMREDIAKIDDPDEWTLDEAGKQFSAHWEHECGKVSLYRVTVREPGADTGTTPPLVTPEMMSKVFAQSVRRKDPDHQHIYDHRIAAELLNKMLAAAERGTTPPTEGQMKRTAEQVVSEWRSTGSTDWGQLVSAINYWAITDMCSALRGTTPPEGLAFTFEEFIDMSLRHNKRLAAGISGIASFGHWYNEMLAATQRAPVEQGPSVLTEAQADRYAAFDDWYDAALKRHKRDELPFSQRAACDYAFEAGVVAAPDHAREGALRMFVWTKSPSWAAVVLAEHVTQARTLLLEEIGSSGDGSCPEREAAAKWVKERTPVIWRGPNAEFALTDSAELREQEFHSEKLQRRVKELERALADGKEGGE